MHILHTLILSFILLFTLLGCGDKSATTQQEHGNKDDIVIPQKGFSAGADQAVLVGDDVTLSVSIFDSQKDFQQIKWKENGKIIGEGKNFTTNTLAVGPHTITLEVIDAQGVKRYDSISITIKAPSTTNTPPTANAFSITLNEDTTSSTKALSGSDSDGDALTYRLISYPKHGKLVGSYARLRYIPHANYHGTDSFYYKTNDGTIDSQVAKVSIMIHAINDAPVVHSQEINVSTTGNVDILLSGEDVDGDSLTFDIAQPPSHMSALTGSGTHYTYTPTITQNATDSFTFTAYDGEAYSQAGTVTIHIIKPPTPIKASPVIIAQIQKTSSPININTRVKWEGDGVTLVDVQLPTNKKETVTFDPTGMVHFTPTWYLNNLPKDVETNATMTYTIKDKFNLTASSTITIPLIGTKDPKAFILTYDTNANKTIKVPVKSTNGFFKIDWGDGNVNTYHDNTDVSTHTYTDTDATHQVKIYSITSIYHWNNGMSQAEKNQLLSIDQWGDTKWNTMYTAFDDCRNLKLKATDIPDLSQVTSMMAMFRGTAINTPINNWDVSHITDMQSVFSRADKFNQPLDNWDVSHVKRTLHMFSGAKAFNQDLSTWDISSIAGFPTTSNWLTMTAMFNDTNLSIDNYDKLLNAWSKLTFQGPIEFTLGTKYTAYDAHKILVDKGWHIIDGGFTSPNPITANPVLVKFEKNPTSSLTISFDENNVQGDDVILTDVALTRNSKGTVSILSDNRILYTPTWYEDNLPKDIVTNVTIKYTITDKYNERTSNIITVPIKGTKDIKPFIVTYDTNSNKTIKVPVKSDNGFFTIDWGDGNVTTYYDDINVTPYTYKDTQDTHQVKIYGITSVIHGNAFWTNGFNELHNQLLSIDQWGDTKWTSMNSAFTDCTNLTLNANDTPNLSNVTEMNQMFKNTAISTNSKMSEWDVSGVKNMSSLFYEASNFNQDISRWDVSNVETMSDMLSGSTLSSRNLDRLLYRWSKLDLKENVTLGLPMGLEYTQITSFNTITSKGWTINNAIENNNPNTYAFITEWETTADNESITIFANPGFDYNYTIEWDDTEKNTSVTGSITHTYLYAGSHTVKIYGKFPQMLQSASTYAEKLKKVTQWGSQIWESMDSAFARCKDLVISATDTPDLSNTSSMRSMFYDATNFDSDISSWDVSNITNMRYILSYAQAFNKDISSWDVSNVTDMGDFFKNASAFDQNLSIWDVSKVTSMTTIFYNTNMSEDNLRDTVTTWITKYPTLSTKNYLKARYLPQ